MGSTDWLISVDDHVVEPPHVWTDRLPSRYADVMPRVVVVDGTDQWVYEDKDKELALLCVKAWNDWYVDEWCASAPGRFIPLMLIPLWDIPEAVKEIQRMAAKGVRALAFSENPASHVLNLPDIHTTYWDPVFQACNDADVVLCTHIGSSSYLPQISPMAPYMANTTWGATRTAGTMLNWLFSGGTP